MSKTRSDLILSFSAQVVYKLIGFAVLALLARHLDKTQFGQLMFAIALTGVAVLLTEFGSSMWLVREVAADPSKGLEHTGDVLSIRLLLMSVYLVLVNGFALVARPEIFLVVAIASVYMGLKDLHRTWASLFLGLKRVKYTVLVFGTSLLLQLVTIVAVILSDGGLPAVLTCYVLMGVSLVALSTIITRRQIGRLRLRLEPGIAPRVIRQSFPLFALMLLGLLHFSADTLMLGFLKPYQEVARYEAGAKLLEASQFLVRPVTMIFLPICVELVTRQDWTELRRITRRLALAATGLGALITTVVIAGAGLIVVIVYGPDYADAADILRVQFLSVPAFYLTIVANFLSISINRERGAILVMATGVIGNVVANISVIPRWGAIGAAWTTVASQGFVALGLAVLILSALRGRSSPVSPSGPDIAEAQQ